MTLYQSLPCVQLDDINRDIRSWIDKNVCAQSFWNPIDAIKFMKENLKFASWCRSVDLKIRSIAVTWGQDSNCCGPHIDVPPARYKLNWPVYNTQQHTWNRWFQAKPDAVSKINHLGGRAFLNYQDLTELDRREVIDPALIDAGVIHDVWCDSSAKFPRIGLQCQIFNEPQSL